MIFEDGIILAEINSHGRLFQGLEGDSRGPTTGGMHYAINILIFSPLITGRKGEKMKRGKEAVKERTIAYKQMSRPWL